MSGWIQWDNSTDQFLTRFLENVIRASVSTVPLFKGTYANSAHFYVERLKRQRDWQYSTGAANTYFPEFTIDPRDWMCSPSDTDFARMAFLLHSLVPGLECTNKNSIPTPVLPCYDYCSLAGSYEAVKPAFQNKLIFLSWDHTVEGECCEFHVLTEVIKKMLKDAKVDRKQMSLEVH